jgi:hypothetical protein
MGIIPIIILQSPLGDEIFQKMTLCGFEAVILVVGPTAAGADRDGRSDKRQPVATTASARHRLYPSMEKPLVFTAMRAAALDRMQRRKSEELQSETRRRWSKIARPVGITAAPSPPPRYHQVHEDRRAAT